ncbi:type II secretion system major pseudopilin GspG [Verrucomicrobiaceae bacterium N1E253]|uniref:Type II secretion system major pseudopilin GspG n=1 Tax=Oceaniferula marina TaxID=2748318 RepID=A0A851GE72_9BACT|nr:type II secretion system major pseudopilin GspG [Oceaniferula marina]NWK54001.1 type II secretion system major pseudopilin GspG [Oceaniferula marina]
MKITCHTQPSRFVSAHSSPFCHRSRRVLSSGFTLLEMVIVLGIIAMIMGGAIFTMQRISDSGAITVVEGDFSSINNALQSYKTNARSYPSQQQGLQALVEKPSTAPRPKRWTRILDEVPKDPWNNEYLYKYPGSKDRSRPEIISMGKDGLEGTEDDLSSQDE